MRIVKSESTYLDRAATLASIEEGTLREGEGTATSEAIRWSSPSANSAAAKARSASGLI